MYRTTASYLSPTFQHRKERRVRDTAILVPLSEIPSVPVEWLWPGLIPRGKLTLLAGDPGLGKSFITLDIASRASRGLAFPGSPPESMPGATPEAMPDGPPIVREPIGTVLLSAEDDPADTIRPRLEAMGADLSKVRALDCIQEAGGRVSEYIIGEHTHVLDAAMEQVPDCGLLVVDPVSAYVGGVDSYNNAQVRSMLKPLSDLAAARRVTVVLVTHLRKAEASKLLHRAMGSLAFAAASRVVLAVTKSPQDPSTRFLLTVKSNLSDDRVGFTYSIENGAVAWGEMVDTETLTGETSAAEAKAEAMATFVEAVKQAVRAEGGISMARAQEIARGLGIGQSRVRHSEWRRKAGLSSRRVGTEWRIDFDPPTG